jgi:vitamin B12 transporter
MGATARYEQTIGSSVHVSLLGSVGRRTIRFVDAGEWVYDWLGNQVAKRNVKGELFREPHDATIWQDSIFVRPSVEWRIQPENVVRVSSTARFTGRTGTDKGTKTIGDKDPLEGERNIFTLMSGIEYELNVFPMPDAPDVNNKKYNPAADNRLQNLVVLKHYFYDAEAQGVPVGQGPLQNLDASGFRFGVGDSLRFRFTKNIAAKASYELATRIPSVDEFFGDSLYVIPNLDVRPEYSHNANAGISLETRRTRLGNFTIEGDWFLRDISNLIVGLAESLGTIQYKNVEGAKI